MTKNEFRAYCLKWNLRVDENPDEGEWPYTAAVGYCNDDLFLGTPVAQLTFEGEFFVLASPASSNGFGDDGVWYSITDDAAATGARFHCDPEEEVDL